MGRGNFCARGDMAEQWYIDYDNYHYYYCDENGDETSEEYFDQDLLDEDIQYIMDEIRSKFPSFRQVDSWDHYCREQHYLLENQLFRIGVADNEWSVAFFIVENEEKISWNCWEGIAEKHYTEYMHGIEKILLGAFSEVYKRNGAWMSSKIERSA